MHDLIEMHMGYSSSLAGLGTVYTLAGMHCSVDRNKLHVKFCMQIYLDFK